MGGGAAWRGQFPHHVHIPPIILSHPLFPSFSPSIPVFPEELSEDGALDIVTPRILYCLIQVRKREWQEREAQRRAPRTQPSLSHSLPPPLHPLLSPPSQLCGLAAALYKLHTMGLLPTHAADYAAQLAPARAAEFVGGGGGVLGGGGA